MITDKKIHWINAVDSTNNEAEKHIATAPEGTVWSAHSQTKGRGQRANKWESEAGKNLTFSILLRPVFLKVENQFLLSKVIALGITDFLNKKGLQSNIKWPNDIYVGDKKIAGILIENHLSGEYLSSTIAGIGLNVNQAIFVSDAPNPTSFFIETKQILELKSSLKQLLRAIEKRYALLKKGKTVAIENDYLALLYRFNEWHDFLQQDKKIRARIVGIRTTGELVLEKESGEVFFAAFKEISYILTPVNQDDTRTFEKTE